MYLVIEANKGRYDRPINIYKRESFKSAREAGDYLKNMLCEWLHYNYESYELFESLNHDNKKYWELITETIIHDIDEQIKDSKFHIDCGEYDVYNFDYDEYNNLTMITKGCPSDNEYIGETYQVVEIKEG